MYNLLPGVMRTVVHLHVVLEIVQATLGLHVINWWCEHPTSIEESWMHVKSFSFLYLLLLAWSDAVIRTVFTTEPYVSRKYWTSVSRLQSLTSQVGKLKIRDDILETIWKETPSSLVLSLRSFTEVCVVLFPDLCWPVDHVQPVSRPTPLNLISHSHGLLLLVIGSGEHLLKVQPMISGVALLERTWQSEDYGFISDLLLSNRYFLSFTF